MKRTSSKSKIAKSLTLKTTKDVWSVSTAIILTDNCARQFQNYANNSMFQIESVSAVLKLDSNSETVNVSIRIVPIKTRISVDNAEFLTFQLPRNSFANTTIQTVIKSKIMAVVSADSGST